MTNTNAMLVLDSKPLETDWDDINALFADMKKFAQENPRHTFLNADDPGMHYQPPRVPRMGWSAFLDNAEDGQSKLWTITIANLKKSSYGGDSGGVCAGDVYREYVRTQAGRKVLLEFIIGRQSEPLPPV